MSIYQRFCQETIQENGMLRDISLHYPDDFNFAYDVADAIAAETPEKKAMVWCNAENEEQIFTFSDVKEQSDRMANAFRAAGLKKGDRVMLVLKRHRQMLCDAVPDGCSPGNAAGAAGLYPNLWLF